MSGDIKAVRGIQLSHHSEAHRAMWQTSPKKVVRPKTTCSRPLLDEQVTLGTIALWVVQGDGNSTGIPGTFPKGYCYAEQPLWR